jgi:hypothetical protein
VSFFRLDIVIPIRRGREHRLACFLRRPPWEEMSRPAHHVIRGGYLKLDPLAIESYQTARRLHPEEALIDGCEEVLVKKTRETPCLLLATFSR